MGSSPQNYIYIKGKELMKMNEYYCTQCESIPQILDIKFDKDIIKFRCKIHEEIELGIKEYFKIQQDKLKNGHKKA